jgi:hypothetical protein
MRLTRTAFPQRLLMAHLKARDRGVVGHLVCADHPEGDVLAAAPLDPPRGTLADATGIGQQRHHHPRVMRRAAMAVDAVGGLERLEVELLHRLDHKPSQTVLIQPVTQIRRQQQRLISVTAEKVLRHKRSFCLQRTENRGVCATPSRELDSPTGSPSAAASDEQEARRSRLLLVGRNQEPARVHPMAGRRPSGEWGSEPSLGLEWPPRARRRESLIRQNRSGPS